LTWERKRVMRPRGTRHRAGPKFGHTRSGGIAPEGLRLCLSDRPWAIASGCFGRVSSKAQPGAVLRRKTHRIRSQTAPHSMTVCALHSLQVRLYRVVADGRPSVSLDNCPGRPPQQGCRRTPSHRVAIRFQLITACIGRPSERAVPRIRLVQQRRPGAPLSSLKKQRPRRRWHL